MVTKTNKKPFQQTSLTSHLNVVASMSALNNLLNSLSTSGASMYFFFFVLRKRFLRTFLIGIVTKCFDFQVLFFLFFFFCIRVIARKCKRIISIFKNKFTKNARTYLYKEKIKSNQRKERSLVEKKQCLK